MDPVITRSSSGEERSPSRARSETSHPEIPDPENPQPKITLPKPLLLVELIENVLPYLNTQDLDSCLQAFDFWKDLIDEEKKRRRDVHPFLWGIPCKEHGKVHECHLPPEEPRSIHHDIRIKAKNFTSRQCVPLVLATRYVTNNAEVLFPDIQPTVITSEYLRLKKLENLERSQSDVVHSVEEKLRKLVEKALGRHFPSSPQQVFFVADYIVGCDEDLKVTDVCSHPAIAGFIIPQYPGFEIRNFEFPRHGGFESIPVDLNIKGLLLFSVNSYNLYEAMTLIDKKPFCDIAFGGYEDEGHNLAPYDTIVAFCGENVETASLVVRSYDEEAEKTLRRFQKSGLLANECFAFAFISRVEEEELRFNLVETFKKLYPDIPICGVISENVYGVNSLPGASEEIQTSSPAKDVSEFHKYEVRNKTVFVLVSIKP